MRCGIYCRLSREDQDRSGESESIQNQRSLLMNYAAAQGWEIYDLYCDEDWSGADASRPDFNRLLTDARLGRVEVVLCKTQSRFTRDMELVERYLHGAFPRWGVRFVAVADHVDTAVKGNKKARQISGLVNQWYLEDLSENVRLVLDHKRRRGEYIGGSPLYGYRLDPADHDRLLPDGPAARVVGQIFHWRLSGLGTRAIAELLEQVAIPSPGAYKQLQRGENSEKTTKWNRIAVSRILRNEMYTGVMVQGRRKRESYKSRRCVDVPETEWFRVEGTHPAIVSPEIFRQVQLLTPPGVRTGPASPPHPLAGRVFCASCGGVLSRSSNGRSSGRREYLRCRRCRGHSVRLEQLTQAVWVRLTAHLAAAGLTVPTEPDRRLLLLAIRRVELGERGTVQPVRILWNF